MIKKNLIAIIDKKLESEHPIITNFLLGGNKFFKSLIICERSTKKKISKNKKFDTYQILRKRRNLGRFLNFFIIYFFLKNIKNSKKERLHIFVRNDPLVFLFIFFRIFRVCLEVYTAVIFSFIFLLFNSLIISPVNLPFELITGTFT